MKDKNIISGTLLISQPLIDDKRFNKKIIIITEHNNEGTLGFIINELTNIKILDLFKDFKIINNLCYLGGPVDNNNLFYFHKKGNIINDSKKIFKNLYFGGNFNQIKEYIKSGIIKEDEICFFLGYCGWTKNQLELELKEKCWIVYNKKINFIDNHLEWSELLIKYDEKYKIWINAQDDFYLN